MFNEKEQYGMEEDIYLSYLGKSEEDNKLEECLAYLRKIDKDYQSKLIDKNKLVLLSNRYADTVISFNPLKLGNYHYRLGELIYRGLMSMPIISFSLLSFDGNTFSQGLKTLYLPKESLLSRDYLDFLQRSLNKILPGFYITFNPEFNLNTARHDINIIVHNKIYHKLSQIDIYSSEGELISSSPAVDKSNYVSSFLQIGSSFNLENIKQEIQNFQTFIFLKKGKSYSLGNIGEKVAFNGGRLSVILDLEHTVDMSKSKLVFSKEIPLDIRNKILNLKQEAFKESAYSPSSIQEFINNVNNECQSLYNLNITRFKIQEVDTYQEYFLINGIKPKPIEVLIDNISYAELYQYTDIRDGKVLDYNELKKDILRLKSKLFYLKALQFRTEDKGDRIKLEIVGTSYELSDLIEFIPIPAISEDRNKVTLSKTIGKLTIALDFVPNKDMQVGENMFEVLRSIKGGLGPLGGVSISYKIDKYNIKIFFTDPSLFLLKIFNNDPLKPLKNIYPSSVLEADAIANFVKQKSNFLAAGNELNVNSQDYILNPSTQILKQYEYFNNDLYPVASTVDFKNNHYLDKRYDVTESDGGMVPKRSKGGDRKDVINPISRNHMLLFNKPVEVKLLGGVELDFPLVSEENFSLVSNVSISKAAAYLKRRRELTRIVSLCSVGANENVYKFSDMYYLKPDITWMGNESVTSLQKSLRDDFLLKVILKSKNSLCDFETAGDFIQKGQLITTKVTMNAPLANLKDGWTNIVVSGQLAQLLSRTDNFTTIFQTTSQAKWQHGSSILFMDQAPKIIRSPNAWLGNIQQAEIISSFSDDFKSNESLKNVKFSQDFTANVQIITAYKCVSYLGFFAECFIRPDMGAGTYTHSSAGAILGLSAGILSLEIAIGIDFNKNFEPGKIYFTFCKPNVWKINDSLV